LSLADVRNINTSLCVNQHCEICESAILADSGRQAQANPT
jgi:hypothetical protein